MILTSISLSNFRNFEKNTFSFNPTLTIVVGNNSVGKTNLLEAVFFACTGKGLKDEKQEELMKLDEETTEVNAVFDDNTFRIMLRKNGYLEKTFFVDKSKKMLAHYNKFTPPVAIFSPELITIIDGQPSLRREFIDHLLSKCDLEYKKRLQNYKNGLRRRNKIIEKENDTEKLKKELPFWNNYLIEQAGYITKKRQWLVDYHNGNTDLMAHQFSMVYEKNEISELRFQEYFMKEFYQRRTLIGPQRDDFRIFKHQKNKKIDVHKYCSRGEQRLALLWLIMNQIRIYEAELKQKPLILLDDIFSELDDSNKKIVIDLIGKYQTIISTTEEEFVENLHSKAKLIHIV